MRIEDRKLRLLKVNKADRMRTGFCGWLDAHLYPFFLQAPPAALGLKRNNKALLSQLNAQNM